MCRLRASAVWLVVVALAIGACDSSTSPSPSPSASANIALASPSVEVSAAPSVSVAPSASPSASASVTPSVAPTPSASPTPAPTPPPWKTYVSKLYHYQISYPPTWIVTPGTTKRADQFDEFGLPVVYVNRDTVSGIVSVSLTVSDEIRYMKSHFQGNVLSNSTIKLAGGYNGKFVTFSAVDDGRKLTVQWIFVGKGKVGYFIEMWGDVETTKSDQRLFKSFYTSWRPR